MMNKEAIMARLAAGESLQTIGDEFAAIMNAAADEYNETKRREAEEAAAKAALEAKNLDEKRALANEFVENVKKYCAISGVDPEFLGEVGIEDVDQLIEALDELMDLIKSVERLSKLVPSAAKKTPMEIPVMRQSHVLPGVTNPDDILKAFTASL